jgi:hypothetical protein
MTTTKALEILKYHNDWRRGLHDIYHYTPTEVGEAIDVAVNHLEYIQTLSAIAVERLFNTDEKPKQ